MNDERRYTIVFDPIYRSDALAWWILEVDMASAVHIGLNLYRAAVPTRSGNTAILPCVYPMTREQVFLFIQRRLADGDWVDIRYLNGFRERDMQKYIRAYVKGSGAL